MPKFKCNKCGGELVAKKPIYQYHSIDDETGAVHLVPYKTTGMDYIIECSINDEHACGFYSKNNKVCKWTEEEMIDEIKKGR